MRLEEKVSWFAWGEVLSTLPAPAGLEKGLLLIATLSLSRLRDCGRLYFCLT